MLKRTPRSLERNIERGFTVIELLILIVIIGTYVGMEASDLVAIDSGISSSLSVASVTATTFCLTDNVNSKDWSVAGPSPQPTDYKANDSCA